MFLYFQIQSWLSPYVYQHRKSIQVKSSRFIDCIYSVHMIEIFVNSISDQGRVRNSLLYRTQIIKSSNPISIGKDRRKQRSHCNPLIPPTPTQHPNLTKLFLSSLWSSIKGCDDITITTIKTTTISSIPSWWRIFFLNSKNFPQKLYHKIVFCAVLYHLLSKQPDFFGEQGGNKLGK